MTFEELLTQKINEPIRDKQGNYIVNRETGQQMNALEAMVMSVVNNAMKGDIASIAFIRNIQRQASGDQQEQHRQRTEEHLVELRDRLTNQLKNEGLYDGQDAEIAMLAETAYLTEQLNAVMHAEDFTPTTTEYDSKGATRTLVNPVIKLRDDQQNRFSEALDKLRQDALKRKINSKNKR